MDHHDVLSLIAAAAGHRSGVSADLGRGTGTFASPRTDLLAVGTRISAVDRGARAVRSLHSVEPGDVDIATVHADVATIDLGAAFRHRPVRGVRFANALHVVRDGGHMYRAVVRHGRLGG